MVDLSEPRLLLLETSGRVGQVGLASGKVLLAARQLDEARRHARDLAPAVAELLGAQGWRPRDLSAVLVSHGPGSYTGLRVGIMSAKAFAYGTACRIVAVPTFTVLAAAVPAPALVDVIEDAQQEHVYCQRFHRESSATLPVPVSALRVLPLAKWISEGTSTAGAADRLVTGPGLFSYHTKLPPSMRLTEESGWRPSLAAFLEVGIKLWQRGEFANLWALEPLYARRSSAEEKWDGKTG